MSPLPAGTEVDGAIPYAGQFFDKGGSVYNVMHPDFGAKGDGTTDDGSAWNSAVTNMPTAGGTIVVPQGAYVLTTAFSFASKTGIMLLLLPGVVLTGSALPAPSGTNSIVDLRNNGVATLASNATPSVAGGHLFKTGGTTTITDFDDGLLGQELKILSAHAITITDGSNILLDRSTNFVMAAGDVLVLRMFNDQVWEEVSRKVNAAVATVTLANDSTPSVANASNNNNFKTGGTTTITDFDDGVVGQTIRILAAHAITITDEVGPMLGTGILLDGSADFIMAVGDALVLTMFNDQVWEETSRKTNVARVVTFTSSDATPTVAGADKFISNATGVTITDLDDGVTGQEITIISGGATVYDTTGTNLSGSSTNITTAAGDTTRWICQNGTTWRLLGYVDISVDNSAGA